MPLVTTADSAGLNRLGSTWITRLRRRCRCRGGGWWMSSWAGDAYIVADPEGTAVLSNARVPEVKIFSGYLLVLNDRSTSRLVVFHQVPLGASTSCPRLNLVWRIWVAGIYRGVAASGGRGTRLGGAGGWWLRDLGPFDTVRVANLDGATILFDGRILLLVSSFRA